MALAPYGGTLISRTLPRAEAEDLRHRAASLPGVRISPLSLSDVYLIAVGGLSPLTGFMRRADYEAVLERMTLENRLPWTIPITLPAPASVADRLSLGDEVALIAPDQRVCAVLHVEEVYDWDREREAATVYGTTDRAHPGVARLDSMGNRLVAGPIDYIDEGDVTRFPLHTLTPAETRAEFERRGWKTIVAFQTRNPVHRAHEYLQKCALEMADGLLLHPLVGETKPDDVPAEVRMACYEVLIEHYYPRDRVLLSVLPAAMRYAGPREAVFHAILRRNYGCTHFIVGRDHAGAGNFYGTYAAHEIFDRIDREKLGIQPLRFEHAFYCRRCGQMVSRKTCPHGQEHHVVLSGTRVREMLSAGVRPPTEFTRPEVAEILIRAYAPALP